MRSSSGTKTQANSKNLPYQAFSIETWIKPTLATKGGILSCYNPLKKSGWSLHIDSDQYAYFTLAVTPGTPRTIKSTKTLSPNTWYHLAAVFDGRKMRLYYNGKEQASAPSKGFIAYDDATSLHLGAMEEKFNLNKKLFKRSLQAETTHVNFSAKALKKKQIAKIYKSRKKLLAKDSAKPLPIFIPSEVTSGVHCSLYKEKQLDISKLHKAKPQNTLQELNLTIPESLKAQTGTMEFFTYYEPEAPGDYSFSVKGDKSAVLYVNNKVAFKAGLSSKAQKYDGTKIPLTLLFHKTPTSTNPKILITDADGTTSELNEDLYTINLAEKRSNPIKLTSNFAKYGANPLEHLIDKNLDTFFFSATKVNTNRHITLEFATPVEAQGVNVVTAIGEKLGNTLFHGVLEISHDGKTFETIAEFTGKPLNISFSKRPVKVVRIKSNVLQHSWIAIYEIKVKSSELLEN